MKKLYFLLFLPLSFLASAQNPGDIAQSFGYTPGFNSLVLDIDLQSDGKILVGGFFTSYKAVAENRLVRLNPNGTKDVSFNIGTGFGGPVRVITSQPDGKIVVGGDFTSFNGATENRIIRLNTDGTKDTSFSTGLGFNGIVRAITLQPDGKILIGGEYTSYNGATENRIIRLNTDGSKDTSFNTGTGFGNIVYSIVVQPDGKVLVGGSFTSYNFVAGNRIIRLNTDGTKDTSFSIGTGFNNIVHTITLQTDGKILTGGEFASFNGVGQIRMIRLNTDGTKDTSFNIGTGFNNTVLVIAIQSDGKILAGGEFTTFNASTENRMVRLNSDGTKDTSFISGTGFDGRVTTIGLQADDKILVGGLFSAYQETFQNKFIRLNIDGTKDTLFSTGNGGFIGLINSIALQPDNKILVGGNFTIYKETFQNRLIRLNVDGTIDSSFSIGTGFDNSITSISIQPDGKIIVGGLFNSYNGTTENRLIRLNTDGTKDTSFVTGTGFSNGVLTIGVQPDGKILLGGAFTSYNGATENRLIRLNVDGTKDTSFNIGTGFNSNVNYINLQADGKILVGGEFISYNGTTENRLIRLNSDGTKDTAFSTGTGFDLGVRIITLQPDGKILLGGTFTSYNGATQNRMILLNTDGTNDTSFSTGIGFNNNVNTITLQPDGKILVGGDFISYNGTTENRLIRLNSDGTKDTGFSTGTGFNNSFINKIILQTNGQILVGGFYTTYNNDNSSANLIALHSETSLGSASFDVSNSLIIYPNPVTDVLHLQTNNFTSIKGVKIYDLQGKLILEDTNETINVSSLTNGLYLVKVATEEGEFTKKFLKK